MPRRNQLRPVGWNGGRLFIHDCGNLDEIESGSMDLVLTDPPYGITSHAWDRAPDWDVLVPAMARVLKPHGQLAVFGTLASLARFMESARGLLTLRFDLVWLKNRGLWLTPKKPIRRHECVAVFALKGAPAGSLHFDAKAVAGRGRPYVKNERRRTHGWARQVGRPFHKVNDGTRWPVTVIPARVVGGGHPEYAGHPTQKPVALMEWLCRALCPAGGEVLDPFAGVGASAVAAALNGLRWTGYERQRAFASRIAPRVKSALQNHDRHAFQAFMEDAPND